MSSTHLLNREEARPSIYERFCSFFSGRRGAANLPIQSLQRTREFSRHDGASLVTRKSNSSRSTSSGNLSVREALEKLRIGCQTFEKQATNLPRGTEDVVKALRARVEELQVLVERAQAWEQRCPDGGKLLWVQISPAAGDEEPPEWALGNLFVTKECLLFEANESPPWSVGPVMWKDIVRVDMLQGSKCQDMCQSTPCDVRLHYKGGITSALRLQLSLVDVAWMERALPKGVEVVPVEATLQVEENVQDGSDHSHDPSECDSFSIASPAPGRGKGQVTPSFTAEANDIYKTSPDPAGLKDAIVIGTLRATVDAIRDSIMQKEGFFEHYAKDKLNAFDINSTPWVASQRFPGTRMNRIRWQMPVPRRLPEDVARLADVPDVLAVTLVSRLSWGADDVFLVQRGYCQNMPYGEHVMVESCYRFRFKDFCCADFQAFVNVSWSIELPSSHAALGCFIESMARSCTVDVGKDFLQQFGGGTELYVVPEAMESVVPNADSPSLLAETLHITGIFTNWATDFEGGRLQPVLGNRPGFAKLKVCLRLDSESLSFAVVSASRGWDWRLYPRDAVPLKIFLWVESHVSKEGMLSCGDPEAVAVGLGNLKIGHGKNFHILEKVGAVVTVWVEVPVTQNGRELSLNTSTVEGARVWYTRENTGVHHVGGDRMDLSKYRSWLPSRD